LVAQHTEELLSFMAAEVVFEEERVGERLVADRAGVPHTLLDLESWITTRSIE
jgi:hypothetical protein